MKTYEFDGTKNQNNICRAEARLYSMAYKAELADDEEMASFLWEKYNELCKFIDETNCAGSGTHHLTLEQLAYAKSVCAWSITIQASECALAGRADLLANFL